MSVVGLLVQLQKLPLKYSNTWQNKFVCPELGGLWDQFFLIILSWAVWPELASFLMSLASFGQNFPTTWANLLGFWTSCKWPKIYKNNLSIHRVALAVIPPFEFFSFRKVEFEFSKSFGGKNASSNLQRQTKIHSIVNVIKAFFGGNLDSTKLRNWIQFVLMSEPAQKC